MRDKTPIEWTDASWNPTTGCSHVSAGCEHCYAEALSLRFGWSSKPWTAPNAAVNIVLHPDRLDQPLRWKRPRRIFVNSMSDLFHARVPIGFIQQVLAVMADTPQHTYQVLTKRAHRLRRIAPQLEFPSNAWIGVSLENSEHLDRVEDLRAVPAAVRFLSCEPLLGPLGALDLVGIDWVIAGGESGPRHRPMDPAWVEEIRDACEVAGVPFFFKQWGGRTPKAGGRTLGGQTYDEMPERVSVAI